MPAAKSKGRAPKLYTLTEVSKKTGISMPTLQRYKKLYQSRIPSEGTGRSQRYKPESLAVFKALKEENVKKRGRPRKSAAPARKAAAPRKRAAAKAKTAAEKSVPKKTAESGLLTLTEVGRRTGISYPTLLRYVRLHISKIPHKGTGRARRFRPTAVDVFKKLRAQSPRGRAASKKPAAATRKVATKAAAPAASTATLNARIRALETSHKKLVRTIERLEKAVQKPYSVVVKR